MGVSTGRDARTQQTSPVGLRNAVRRVQHLQGLDRLSSGARAQSGQADKGAYRDTVTSLDEPQTRLAVRSGALEAQDRGRK